MAIQAQDNKHLAGALRRGLESKHSKDTPLRQTLDQLTDVQLIRIYLDNEQRGRDHVINRGVRLYEKATSTIDQVTHVR